MATIEVRAMPADPADIDEVVLTAGDGCTVHLERLDEQIAYLAVYRPDNRRVMLHILVEEGVLRCRLVEDERTAEEKAKDVGGPVLTGEQSVGDEALAFVPTPEQAAAFRAKLDALKETSS